MKAFGVTNRGAVRKENQDTFRFEAPETAEQLTAVLCDGMGGARAGGIASNLAADSFVDFVGVLGRNTAPSEMRAMLIEGVNRANTAVYDRSFDDFKCIGMGTTLVALLVCRRHVAIGNVGDSRAYLYSRNRLQQLTTDHSLVEELVKAGRITREEGRTHPRKNVITRAIGVDASVKCDVTELRLPADARFLLCSDGLSNIVTEEEMLALLLRHPEPEPACQALVALALERGAPDNVTVLIAQH